MQIARKNIKMFTFYQLVGHGYNEMARRSGYSLQNDLNFSKFNHLRVMDVFTLWENIDSVESNRFSKLEII